MKTARAFGWWLVKVVVGAALVVTSPIWLPICTLLEVFESFGEFVIAEIWGDE